MPAFEWRRLLRMLTDQYTALSSVATAVSLDPVFVSRTLRGVSLPGEPACIWLARGLRALHMPDAESAVGLLFADGMRAGIRLVVPNAS